MKKFFLLLLVFCHVGLINAQHTHEESEEHKNDTITAQSYNEDLEGNEEHDSNEVISSDISENKSVKANLDEFPNLHPLIVHFPIVLLLLGAFLQIIQVFVLKRNLDWVILLCVGAGFIGAYIAGVYAHPHTHDLTETAKKVLEQHDTYAEWTIYASALGAVLKLGSLFLLRKNRLFEIAILLVLGFAAFSVSEAGHYGSQLVYLEGVGPQGDYLESEEESHLH